jgi:hypothetical protein
MADPITIALVASAATAAVGAVAEGQAQKEAYKAQANVNEYNAKVSDMNAQIARNNASVREEAMRRKSRQILGQQRGALGQAGIEMSGSALDIVQQSTTMAELDALNTRYEGDLQARGLIATAAGERYQAAANRVNAKNAQTASFIKAGAAVAGAYATSTYLSAGTAGTTGTTGLGTQALGANPNAATGYGVRPTASIGLR